MRRAVRTGKRRVPRLVHRVILGVGLAQGQIIRLSHASIVRIAPGAFGDAA